MFLYINYWRYERKRQKKHTGSDSDEVPIEIH